MYRGFFKRMIDIVMSLMALPFVAMLVLIIGPIIYFWDRGPIFYVSPRVGRNGKTFSMIKLRSMYINAPDIRNADGSTYNGKDDPRVTGIGRFIRKTSIDELPQFINVLKGDMSIVGPRPDLPDHIEQYTPQERQKLTVRPGVTGYSQAYYRNSVDLKARLANDVYYTDKLSFWLDCKILFKTVPAVLSSKGVHIAAPAVDLSDVSLDIKELAMSAQTSLSEAVEDLVLTEVLPEILIEASTDESADEDVEALALEEVWPTDLAEEADFLEVTEDTAISEHEVSSKAEDEEQYEYFED